MSAPPLVCLECGAPLAAGSPAHLCGACLLGEAPVQPMLQVPGHEVLEELARGGMGVVYRARERETQRTVALKMLRPRLADEEGMRERFRMEAAAVAALNHPAILPVYRVDETEAMPFFTMMLAAGGTLADRRDHYRRQWRETAVLMVTLAGAVQYAHQHGVLHRDLKPANVLFDAEGRAYLSDFGLVKLIDSVSELTGSMSFLGTPHYASPEVASSSAGAATVASDVWSLGAMLYELLTGRLPFDAPGLVPLLRKIAEEPPAPFKPSDGVPSDLGVITLKCLQPDPAQRYESAAALGADLTAWLEGRPIKARAARLPERLLAWGKRNPALAALAAALQVSLALLAFLLWRGYTESRQSAAEARRAQASALLSQVKAQARDGQWTDRGVAVETVLRSHALEATEETRDVLVSLLALPELVQTGAIPYGRQNGTTNGGGPVFLDGGFARYAARAKGATEVRQALTHEVLFTVPEAAAGNFEPGPLSADGRLLMVPAATQTAIWDLAAGRKLAVLPNGHWKIGFSGDGAYTGSDRRVVQLDVDPPRVINLAETECDLISLSPDGKLALAAHRSRLLLQLTDNQTGALVRSYALPGNSMVLRASWSSRSTHFVTGATDGRVMLWNVNSSAPEWMVPAHTDGIDGLALFAGDTHIVSQGRDGLTKIWNPISQAPVLSLPWSGRRVQVPPDGLGLALDCSATRETRLYRFTPSPVCSLIRLPASYVPNSFYQGRGSVVPAADGTGFAVTAGFDINLLDRDGVLLRTVACGQCMDLINNPAGPGFIRSWRNGSQYELMRVPPDWPGTYNEPELLLGKWPREQVLLAHFRIGPLLVGSRGSPDAVEPATGARRTHALPGLPAQGRLTAMALSPCGRYSAWAGVEDEKDPSRRLHLMDATAEQEIAVHALQVAPRRLAFLADGSAVIAGNNDYFQCLDTLTGRERWKIRHRRPQDPTLKTPICLAIAGKAGTVAIPLTTDSISLIDPATGRIRVTLRHPMGHTLRDIGLSPDGSRLVAVGSYLAQIWKLDAVAGELTQRGMVFRQ